MVRKRSLGFGTMSHILSFVHVQPVVKHENPVCRRELSVATSSVWLPAESRLSSILKSFYRSGHLPDSTIQNTKQAKPPPMYATADSRAAFYVQQQHQNAKVKMLSSRSARKQCHSSSLSYCYTFRLIVHVHAFASLQAVATVIIWLEILTSSAPPSHPRPFRRSSSRSPAPCAVQKCYATCS